MDSQSCCQHGSANLVALGDDDDRPPALKRPRIGLVKLGRADVVRHPVIDDVLDLYDEGVNA